MQIYYFSILGGPIRDEARDLHCGEFTLAYRASQDAPAYRAGLRGARFATSNPGVDRPSGKRSRTGLYGQSIEKIFQCLLSGQVRRAMGPEAAFP